MNIVDQAMQIALTAHFGMFAIFAATLSWNHRHGHYLHLRLTSR